MACDCDPTNKRTIRQVFDFNETLEICRAACHSRKKRDNAKSRYRGPFKSHSVVHDFAIIFLAAYLKQQYFPSSVIFSLSVRYSRDCPTS